MERKVFGGLLQALGINAGRRTLNFKGVYYARVKVGSAVTVADDGIRISYFSHRLQTPEQECPANALTSGILGDADRAEKIPVGTVETGESGYPFPRGGNKAGNRGIDL